MTHRSRGFGLAATLVLVSAVAFVPQASAQSTLSTAAHVYIQIQGPEGTVYGFNASSTGQLSAISGSPFKPAGAIVGGTPTKFLTLGQNLIHSYGTASNGAIGSQLAQEPVLDYAGSRCGGGTSAQDGAQLDHTGRYIYVMLEYGAGGCAAYQSYIINSDGSFEFDGDTELDWGPGGFDAGLPSILGDESYAYSLYLPGYFEPTLSAFRREGSGTLELMQFHETDPSGNYSPLGPDASPTGNYVVVQLFPNDTNPPQLGSYAVDAKGNISTTNTSGDMPTSALINPGSTFSPSGTLFVLYSNSQGYGTTGGIEIYEFNGATPLTLWKTVLSNTPIDQVAWDSSNHLYAISSSTNKLYVFTVTPTSVTQDAAWSIGAPYKMVVVSE
jgi:hypothetical protein